MLSSTEFYITIQRYINNCPNLARKYVRICVRGPYLFQDAKTVSFEEQIMSKDQYPYKRSRKIDACVFYPSNILQRIWKNVHEQLTELN